MHSKICNRYAVKLNFMSYGIKNKMFKRSLPNTFKFKFKFIKRIIIDIITLLKYFI